MSDALIPLFTYGTLQPGASLWSMLGPYVKKPPVSAYVRGFDLYANASNTYPYLVEGKEHCHVYGTMTFLPYVEGGALDRICQMEVGAGYAAETVDARYLQADATGKRFFTDVRALAFVWPQSNRSHRFFSSLMGERIESGSWLEWNETVPDDVETIAANRLVGRS